MHMQLFHWRKALLIIKVVADVGFRALEACVERLAHHLNTCASMLCVWPRASVHNRDHESTSHSTGAPWEPAERGIATWLLQRRVIRSTWIDLHSFTAIRLCCLVTSFIIHLRWKPNCTSIKALKSQTLEHGMMPEQTALCTLVTNLGSTFTELLFSVNVNLETWLHLNCADCNINEFTGLHWFQLFFLKRTRSIKCTSSWLLAF